MSSRRPVVVEAVAIDTMSDRSRLPSVASSKGGTIIAGLAQWKFCEE